MVLTEEQRQRMEANKRAAQERKAKREEEEMMIRAMEDAERKHKMQHFQTAKELSQGSQEPHAAHPPQQAPAQPPVLQPQACHTPVHAQEHPRAADQVPGVGHGGQHGAGGSQCLDEAATQPSQAAAAERRGEAECQGDPGAGETGRTLPDFLSTRKGPEYQADLRDMFSPRVAQEEAASQPEACGEADADAPLKLSEEQQHVVDQAKTGKNIFVTGCGGTGKSFLMNQVIDTLKHKYGRFNVAVCATTGIAATHIGGVSFHQFTGIGLGHGSVDELVKKIRGNQKANMRWSRMRAMVIDEVSMLDGPLFDKVEAVAKKMKNSNSPFGGIQLLLVGDFLQLPPVSKGKEAVFCFEAKAWPTCVDVHVELKTVFRQKDQSFVDALNAVRWGVCDDHVVRMLNAAKENTLDTSNGIRPTKLFGKNVQVDDMNAHSLREIPTKSRCFEAEEVGEPYYIEQLEKTCLAPRVLELKETAQVMLLKNLDTKEGLSNGSRGVVTSFQREINPSTGFEEDFVAVKFETKGGDIIQYISTHGFQLDVAGKTVATRYQFPLRLAYAITIHKCQGMTLSKVEMSVANMFETGQAYVALSRATTPQGLKLLSWDTKSIKANHKVVAFYRTIGIYPPKGLNVAAVGKGGGYKGGGGGVGGGFAGAVTPVAARVEEKRSNPLLEDE